MDSPRAKAMLILEDSMWFGICAPCIDLKDLGRYHKLFKLGFSSWKSVWNNNSWSPNSLDNISIPCVDLLVSRIQVISDLLPLDMGNLPLNQILQWSTGKTLIPLPRLIPNNFWLVLKINRRWGLQWSPINGNTDLNASGLFLSMLNRRVSFGS